MLLTGSPISTWGLSDMSAFDDILRNVLDMITSNLSWSLFAAFVGAATGTAGVLLSLLRVRNKKKAEEKFERLLAEDRELYRKIQSVLKSKDLTESDDMDHINMVYKYIDDNIRNTLRAMSENERTMLSEALYQKSMSGRYRYLKKLVADINRRREVVQ